MPKYKPGYGPDGTPQPKKPQKPSGKKYGPDGFPIPQPSPETPGRHWIPAKSGVDRDGTAWTIPGHWSDDPAYNPAPPAPPVFRNEHSCHIDGAFIVLGGYVSITDNDVPKGTRGHELYLYLAGVGVGGMSTHGVLHIHVGSWDEFYNRVASFAYIGLAPSLDVPASQLGHTALCFYDGNSNPLGYALPDISIDIGIGGGTVAVKE